MGGDLAGIWQGNKRKKKKNNIMIKKILKYIKNYLHQRFPIKID